MNAMDKWRVSGWEWWLTVFAIAVALTVAANAEPLLFTTEQYPPFNLSDDDGKTITGISTDTVREMAKRAGVPVRIELYPWARAYNMALEHRNTCVFSTTRTDWREKLFKWVGPLVENPWVLYARDDSLVRIEKLEDAKPYRIGGYIEDAVAGYLKRNGYNVEEAPADRNNPQKLATRRIDFWATGKLLGAYYTRSERVTGIRPILTFKMTYMYLACNLNVPDMTIADLNEALKAMERDGSQQRIEQKYQ